MFNNNFLQNSLSLVVFFCVSLSLAEASKGANTKNLKTSSGSVKTEENLKASSESVQSTEKPKPSSDFFQTGEKVESFSEAPKKAGELKAPLEFTHPAKNPLKAETVAKSLFKENYRFYAGPSLLRRIFNGRSRFFGETFTLGLSRKNWEYRDIYVNLRPLIEANRKVTHLEFLTRMFCSLSFENLKTYTGIGMGFGLSPYHIYSKNRNIDRILSLNYQLFTGLRLSNVYKDFGAFGEINVTGLFFPFFIFFKDKGPRIVSKADTVLDRIEFEEASKSSSSSDKSKAYIDTLLNVGILYNF